MKLPFEFRKNKEDIVIMKMYLPIISIEKKELRKDDHKNHYFFLDVICAFTHLST